MDSQGNLVQTYWDDGKEDWKVVGLAPKDKCDVYGTCSANGSCDSLGSSICSCMRGFEPKILEEWNCGNWSSGCVRRKLLQCERLNSSVEEGRADGFFRLNMVKVPDFAQWSYGTKDDCQKQFLQNCFCVAYAYDTGIGFMSWRGNLVDLQQFLVGGSDIYSSGLFGISENERHLKVIITVTVIIGVIAIASTAYFLWRWMAKKTTRNC
ncbi:hypothetical protein ACB092_05G258700 [Castanea dentata]